MIREECRRMEAPRLMTNRRELLKRRLRPRWELRATLLSGNVFFVDPFEEWVNRLEGGPVGVVATPTAAHQLVDLRRAMLRLVEHYLKPIYYWMIKLLFPNKPAVRPHSTCARRSGSLSRWTNWQTGGRSRSSKSPITWPQTPTRHWSRSTDPNELRVWLFGPHLVQVCLPGECFPKAAIWWGLEVGPQFPRTPYGIGALKWQCRLFWSHNPALPGSFLKKKHQ